MRNENEKLKLRVRELEEQLTLLQQTPLSKSMGPTVIVPDEMKPLFELAQQTVNSYYTKLKMEPTKGTIEINDQRYILIRASSLSKDFLDTIKNLYADRGEAEAMTIGKNFLFDIAHTLGINDAKNFHATMSLVEPIAKLSAGPVHFAFTGWAFVEILPESNPSPDNDFYLIYNHPFSFEADSWIRSGIKSDTHVCIMSTGYSSG
ncbi:MAG: XylR N-terminal domain-containing protein [Ferruginibacter sp.]